MGILSGIAGAVVGGSEAAAKSAEDFQKLGSQQLLNQQMADLHVQEVQRVADYQRAKVGAIMQNATPTRPNGMSDHDYTTLVRNAQKSALNEAGMVDVASELGNQSKYVSGGLYATHGMEQETGEAGPTLTEPGMSRGDVQIAVANARKEGAESNAAANAPLRRQQADETAIKTVGLTHGNLMLPGVTGMDGKPVADTDLQATAMRLALAHRQFNPDGAGSEAAYYASSNLGAVKQAAELRTLREMNPGVPDNKLPAPNYSDPTYLGKRATNLDQASQNMIRRSFGGGAAAPAAPAAPAAAAPAAAVPAAAAVETPPPAPLAAAQGVTRPMQNFLTENLNDWAQGKGAAEGNNQMQAAAKSELFQRGLLPAGQ